MLMCPVVKTAADRLSARSLSLIVAGLAMLMLLNACMSARWGLQAVDGQMDVLSRRTDIDQLLADEHTPERLRDKLWLAQSIREYAITELGLPDSNSYRSYADLQRDAAVWSVVASAPDQLEPKTWCFLLVGCLAYRGWFDQQDAWHEARLLRRRKGLDVMVSPATAYSTLGWFDDPLTNIMLAYPAPLLAELLFHEMSHEQLYIADDTAFNEAYATAVAEIGVERWLRVNPALASAEDYRQQKQIDALVDGWIADARAQLIRVYQAAGTAEQKIQGKQAVIAGLRQRWLLAMLSSEPGSFPYTALSRWRSWFAQPLNNAHFVLHATYRQGVARLLQVYDCLHEDLTAFYAAAAAMSEWSVAQRRDWLAQPALDAAAANCVSDPVTPVQQTVQQSGQGLQ
jgi:predicted aminopeptidase